MGNNDKPLGMSGGMPAGELLPCPNPWCERIEGVEVYQHLVTERWHVCCDDCMIEGPWAKTYDEAVAAWNTRATPTPPIEGRDADVERVRALVEAVEAGKFDALDAVADQWIEGAGIVRMCNAIASVFEAHAPQEIMDRFRAKLADMMHLASAPAGDGVEEAAQAILKDLRGQRLLKWLFAEGADTNPVAIGYVDGPIDEATQLECATSWAKIAIAFARPRAAVGEQSREAIARIIDPDAFATYPFDPDRCEDFIAAIEQAAEDALAKADAILALQSPPAKAEE